MRFVHVRQRPEQLTMLTMTVHMLMLHVDMRRRDCGWEHPIAIDGVAVFAFEGRKFHLEQAISQDVSQQSNAHLTAPLPSSDLPLLLCANGLVSELSEGPSSRSAFPKPSLVSSGPPGV